MFTVSFAGACCGALAGCGGVGGGGVYVAATVLDDIADIDMVAPPGDS